MNINKYKYIWYFILATITIIKLRTHKNVCRTAVQSKNTYRIIRQTLLYRGLQELILFCREMWCCVDETTVNCVTYCVNVSFIFLFSLYCILVILEWNHWSYWAYNKHYHNKHSHYKHYYHDWHHNSYTTYTILNKSIHDSQFILIFQSMCSNPH